MRIGLDGNEANVEKQVGVSVYTLQILAYAKNTADSKTQFRVFLRSKPLPHMPKENEWFRYIVIPGPIAWLRTSLPLYLYLKHPVDVLFSPAHYSPSFCPIPLVVTIHDLSYFYYPHEFLKKDLYKLTHWTRTSIQKASRVICVSQTTKKDVMKEYHVPEEKITVIYNGYEKKENKKTFPFQKAAQKYALQTKEYILYTGTIQPRKNIAFLIRSFLSLIQEYPKLKLVIAGKKGWLYDEIFQLVQNLSLEKKVVLTDYIPDDELICLYRNALCFVHPSLYEGFGLPILEAMAYHCPVVSSFSSSLPEIGGDACLYFDPKDETDLREKVSALIKNKSLREQLIAKGKDRIKLFSWKKTGQETIDILKKTA